MSDLDAARTALERIASRRIKAPANLPASLQAGSMVGALLRAADCLGATRLTSIIELLRAAATEFSILETQHIDLIDQHDAQGARLAELEAAATTVQQPEGSPVRTKALLLTDDEAAWLSASLDQEMRRICSDSCREEEPKRTQRQKAISEIRSRVLKMERGFAQDFAREHRGEGPTPTSIDRRGL